MVIIMIKIYKTNKEDGMINETKNIEINSWINIIEPTEQEIQKISNLINIDESRLKSFLDEEEQARTEIEENYNLIVLDIPVYEKNETYLMSITVPLVILQVNNEYIITICTKKTDIFNDFIQGKVKTFFTGKKSRFTIQLMLKVAERYIRDLKIINDEVNKSEKSLRKSTNNNDLLKLMNLQKSLVYFSTSLRSNNLVLEKLQKNILIPLYDEDKDVLEDVIIENKQAIEMATIYSEILSSTINVFGTIISNNLNGIMKFLAGFTIVISIPTMVASFMGMNVPLGFFENNGLSFLILFIVSLILSLFVAYILKKKNML